jgi:transcriptional regulator with XRE-family HTH domain
MSEAEIGIKKKFKEYGITIKQVADFFKISYTTLNSQLNGFSPLTKDNRKKINTLLSMAESDANLFAHLESIGKGDLAAHFRQRSGYFTEKMDD